MRTYPKNIKELEEKHNFSLPINEQKLETIRNDIILRHDFAFLFLKSRILNSLKEENKIKDDISLDSFLEKKIGNKDRIRIYNAIRDKIPFPMDSLEKSGKYYLLLLGVFILPWIIYLIVVSKDNMLMLFSFAYPQYFAILVSLATLLVVGFDYLFGRFFKNDKLPIEFRELTIRDTISKIINNNRKEIKERFKIVFKNDIEKFK